MAQELKRLMKHGYVERATDFSEDCFVGPSVTTEKEDDSVKVALDSRKLKEMTVKR